MMKEDNQSRYYDKKIYVASLSIINTSLIILLLFAIGNELIFYGLLTVLFASILVHMRWLMKIYDFKKKTKDKNQKEALDVAMSSNMTISHK